MALSSPSVFSVWKGLWFLLFVVFITLSLQTVHFILMRPATQDESGYKRAEARFARHVHSIQRAESSNNDYFDVTSLAKPCNCDDVSEMDVTVEPKTAVPLITLFTSMKDSSDRLEIHNNTIHNWASLIPEVIPVLYTDNGTGKALTDLARKLVWSTRPVPKATQRIPILKALYDDAIKAFNTPYYAFANADILFDGSLLATLRSLQGMNVTDAHYRWTGRPNTITDRMTVEAMKRRPATGGLLIVGRRTNVNTSDITPDSIHTSKLSHLASEKGKLFVTNAQDYFITTANGLPWQHVPDFVIGRPGYDNWLVVKALDWKLTAIDASDVILAVHQTGNDGNLAGWASDNSTLCVNRNLVGRFDYRPGHTKCCLWAIQRDISGSIRVFRRSAISKDCARIGKNKKYNKKCV